MLNVAWRLPDSAIHSPLLDESTASLWELVTQVVNRKCYKATNHRRVPKSSAWEQHMLFPLTILGSGKVVIVVGSVPLLHTGPNWERPQRGSRHWTVIQIELQFGQVLIVRHGEIPAAR